MSCVRIKTQAEIEEREKEWERELEEQKQRYRDWGVEWTTPKETPTTPSNTYQYYAPLSLIAMDSFKKIKDVNPKVIQDLTDIFEKYPCNDWVYTSLERTVSVEMM